jgi:hypothetical protein
MRRILPTALLALVLLPCLVWSAFGDIQGQTGVKMVVLSKDGKKIAYKIVSYQIFELQGKWRASWDEVKWYYTGGKVGFNSVHYSTDEGSISNLKVREDLATFDINPLRGSIHVIVRPPDKYSLTNDIKAFAAYPDVTEEWVVTDDPIYLPAKEVFGIPTVAEKSLRK